MHKNLRTQAIMCLLTLKVFYYFFLQEDKAQHNRILRMNISPNWFGLPVLYTYCSPWTASVIPEQCSVCQHSQSDNSVLVKDKKKRQTNNHPEHYVNSANPGLITFDIYGNKASDQGHLAKPLSRTHSLTHSSWHVCVDVDSRTIRLNTSFFWASLPASAGLICSHFLMSSVHLHVDVSLRYRAPSAL